MADATRDVVIRLALETAEGSVRSVEKANKAVTDSYDHLLKRVEQTQKQLKDDAWAEEQQRQSQIAVDAAITFGSSLMQVGEASLRAARGIAFLIAANEEDAKAMLKYIVVAQGVFDSIKGGIGIIQGAYSAYVSLKTATEAATVATTAFQVAMGPVGWTIAGIGLAISGAALAYQALGNDAEESAEKQKKASKEAEKTVKEQIKAVEKLRTIQAKASEEMLGFRRKHKQVSIKEELSRFEEAGLLAGQWPLAKRAPPEALTILGTQIEAGESVLGMIKTNIAREKSRYEKRQRILQQRRERIYKSQQKEVAFRATRAGRKRPVRWNQYAVDLWSEQGQMTVEFEKFMQNQLALQRRILNALLAAKEKYIEIDVAISQAGVQ